MRRRLSHSQSATEAMRREVERRIAAIDIEFPDRPWRHADGGRLVEPLLAAGWEQVDIDRWMCTRHPALDARPADLIRADRHDEVAEVIALESRGTW